MCLGEVTGLIRLDSYQSSFFQACQNWQNKPLQLIIVSCVLNCQDKVMQWNVNLCFDYQMTWQLNNLSYKIVSFFSDSKYFWRRIFAKLSLGVFVIHQINSFHKFSSVFIFAKHTKYCQLSDILAKRISRVINNIQT